MRVLGTRTPSLGNSKDREIVCLGPSAGEDQPIGFVAIQVGPEDLGHALPGVFQDTACPLSRLMLTGRVGIAGRVAADHGLDDLGSNGGGGIVVKVDMGHEPIMR